MSSEILLRATLDTERPYDKAERILIKRLMRNIKAMHLGTRSEITGVASIRVLDVEEVLR
jgi:hypothetical protein